MEIKTAKKEEKKEYGCRVAKTTYKQTGRQTEKGSESDIDMKQKYRNTV